MRNLFILCLSTLGLLSVSSSSHAQAPVGVGIGTLTPNASAALDINSSRLGVLFPRVALTGKTDAVTVSAPATGLVVYNPNATIGGTPQLVVNAGTPTSPNWLPLSGLNWGLTGNADTTPAANFLGTTDNQPLVIKTNGQEVARFQPGGAVWLGGQVPNANLFMGYQAGMNNTNGLANPTFGSYNQFVGYQAGAANTTGNSNQFFGYQAGMVNNSGSNNIFFGYQSGYRNVSGLGNQCMGYQAGFGNTTGDSNLFLGYYTGYSNTSGRKNVFVGYQAGVNNSTGSSNHFIGSNAGQFNSTGANNTFNGYYAGYLNSVGTNGYFSGYQAGYSNTTGNNNQFIGYQAGYSNTTGSNNIAIGYNAGRLATTSSFNTAIGYQAGTSNSTGSNNLFLGYQADLATASTQRSNATAIGYQAKVDQDNALVLGGTGPTAVKVGIGTTTPGETLTVEGNILASGTITQNSDRRLKANVRPLTGTLASLDLLRGVRYTFLPGKGPVGEQIGVIAQEVEQVYPELVRTDARTGIKSVNYAQLTPVLLEAIKELKTELAGARAALRQEHDQTTAALDALTTRLQALEATASR